MSKPLYIYNAGNFYHEIPTIEPLPSLKHTLQAATGNKIRRIDRFTQLALIGCFHCRADTILPENTGLYLSSISGPLNNTRTVLAEIFQDGELPRPLNFINAVSNSACFHLAEQLGLTSYNQFVSREHFTFEAALKLAQIDIEIGNIETALVGIVSESGEIFNPTPGTPPLTEGSFWFYIGNNKNHEQPVAKITQIKEPLSRDALINQLLALSDKSESGYQVAFGKQVSEVDIKLFLKIAGLVNIMTTPSERTGELHTASQLNHFISACQSDDAPNHLVYIDTDKANHYCMITLESCKD